MFTENSPEYLGGGGGRLRGGTGNRCGSWPTVIGVLLGEDDKSLFRASNCNVHLLAETNDANFATNVLQS